MTYQSSDLPAAIGFDAAAIDTCVAEAARVINVEACELLLKVKTQRISYARQGAMWLAHSRGVKQCELALYFDVDHSTVAYGIKHAQARYDTHASKPAHGATT
jgi:chromosomal replication initiation ATPase DnaA